MLFNGTEYFAHRTARAPVGRRRAFTLIEMLVVLVIIGLLAALALPHIRGHTESVAIDAAMNQLVADLALARQKAITQRGSVAMIFLTDAINPPNISMGLATPNETKEIERLRGGIYTHYALFAFRKAGEQPGQGTQGYITEWKSLPEKTFFSKDSPLSILALASDDHIPFPFSTSQNEVKLPYIAFDAEGHYVKLSDSFNGRKDSVLPANDSVSIARGAVFYSRDDQGRIINFELQEIPPNNSTGNVVRIDFLTGRAKREQPALP